MTLLSTPDLDTWLARHLHQRGGLDMQTLLGLLAQVRSDPAAGTLAEVLARRGLVPEAELLAALGEARQAHEETGAAGSPTAPGDWRPGQRIDGLLIESALGAGGMGAVYAALDTATGARYAVKVLPADATPEDLLRFRREAEAQARADQHPNVVRIHRMGRAAGRAYLVMDLATGGDLGALLARGPLPARDAAALIRDLARGLAHVHEHGVLHRDLKPANVVFGEGGVPKLMDFGLARCEGAETLTQSGTILGTPSYMAPEQIDTQERNAVGAAADVYGLGAVLYHCLTGRAPFAGNSVYSILLDVLSAPPTPPRILAPETPIALEAICLRALEKAPADRPASAAALASELDRFLAGDEVGGPRSGRPRLRRPLAFGAAAVGLVAAAVAWGLTGDAGERARQPVLASPTGSRTHSDREPTGPPTRSDREPTGPHEAPPPTRVVSEAEIERRLNTLGELQSAMLRERKDAGVALARECEELLALRPKDERVLSAAKTALLYLAQAHHQAREWTLALRFANKAKEIRADSGATDPMLAQFRGKALLELGRLEEAAEAYSEALDTVAEEDAGTLLMTRARIYRGLEKDALSLKDLDRAFSLLRGKKSDLYRERGISLRRLGRLPEALESLDQALAREPDHAGCHRERGKARSLAGDVEGAIADFTRALQLTGGPEPPRDLLHRSALFKRAGRLERAEADLVRFLRRCDADSPDGQAALEALERIRRRK